MKRLPILALLLFATPMLHAQAIQEKTCDHTGGYVLPCTFNTQPVAGDLLVIPAEGACTITCMQFGGALPFSDSCGNTWQESIVVPYYNGTVLWYALNAKPSCKPTINFISGGVWKAFLAEYPAVTGLDAVSDNTYAWQNLDEPAGQSNDESWVWIETSQACDLVIAWDMSGNATNTLYTPTPGFGYTLGGTQDGDFMFESMVATGAGYYYPNVKWNNGGAHWTMGVAAFKTNGGCH